MRAEYARDLLELIGCRQIKAANDKLLATCPFEHEHRSGRDTHPSFVIFTSTEEESSYYCSYPHAPEVRSGSMERLVEIVANLRGLPVTASPWGVWDDKGSSLDALYRYVWTYDRTSAHKESDNTKKRAFSAEPFGLPAAHKDRFTRDVEALKDEPDPALPRKYLDQFEYPEGKALKYLTETRGLTKETIDHWELLYCPRWRYIAIPVYNLSGELVSVSRRALFPDQVPKYHHAKGFKRRNHLFGENPQARAPLTKPKNRGIIVEGQFDVIRLWQYGYRNVVAIFGADMTHKQLDLAYDLFSSVVILTDGDDAGRKAGQKIKQQLETGDKKVPTTIVPMPDGLDPGDLNFTKQMAIDLLGAPDVDPKVDSDKFPWE